MSATAEVFCETDFSRPTAPPVAEPETELPVTLIERRPGWQLVNLGELWSYRELLLILAWRDIKVRYKQTVLGAAWAVLQPVATMLVFSVFFGRMAQAPSDAAASPLTPYPLFVFAGLLLWFFFANTVVSASQSMLGNQSLVTKVYFPRLLIPISAAGPYLLDFFIGFGLLIVMMLAYGVTLGWGLLLVPVFALALTASAVGMGILLSALTVAYRDFRYVVPFMIQLWMFATPAIYMRSDVLMGTTGRWLMMLNPIHGLIVNFRAAVLSGPSRAGGEFDLTALALSLAVGLVFLAAGCFYFRRVERNFADIM